MISQNKKPQNAQKMLHQCENFGNNVNVHTWFMLLQLYVEVNDQTYLGGNFNVSDADSFQISLFAILHICIHVQVPFLTTRNWGHSF